MPKVSLEQVKQLPHSKLSKALDRVKKRLKNNQVVKDMFKKFKIDLNELDFVPMCFADLDVSARTEHGIIYLNYSLLADGDFDKDDHYLTHELTHFCQQTTGDGPTKGSTDDNYLDNPAEQEGFKNQTEYLSETRGDDAAKNYVNKVLDHHDVPEDERGKRKRELLNLASKIKSPQQLKLDLFKKKDRHQATMNKTKEELMQDFEEALVRGPQENHGRTVVKKIHPLVQKENIRRLKEILEVLSKNASYFWDEVGKYNAESPSDRADIDPNQMRLKFRDLSNRIVIFAKKFDQLSIEELKKIERLKLGGESNMTDFLEKWKSGVRPVYMPIAVIAKDLENGNYAGWALAQPTTISKNGQPKLLEIDVFVDKSYRSEGIGTLLINKLKEIKANQFPNTTFEVGPWSPMASNFYQKTISLEDPYQRYVDEDSEEKEKETSIPIEQEKLPFRD